MNGQRLAALRGARGLTKEQIAVMADVTVDAVKKWEGKGTIPGTDKFVAIARALGLSLDDLATELGLIDRPRRADALPPDLAAISERMQDIPRLWQHMSSEERKALIHLVVERIVVGPSGAVEVTPRF